MPDTRAGVGTNARRMNSEFCEVSSLAALPSAMLVASIGGPMAARPRAGRYVAAGDMPTRDMAARCAAGAHTIAGLGVCNHVEEDDGGSQPLQRLQPALLPALARIELHADLIRLARGADLVDPGHKGLQAG